MVLDASIGCDANVMLWCRYHVKHAQQSYPLNLPLLYHGMQVTYLLFLLPFMNE
jgi:hypothetical protein